MLWQPFGEHHHTRDATMLRSPRPRSDASTYGLCFGNVWLLTKPIMNNPQTWNACNIVLIAQDVKQDAKYWAGDEERSIEKFSRIFVPSLAAPLKRHSRSLGVLYLSNAGSAQEIMSMVKHLHVSLGFWDRDVSNKLLVTSLWCRLVFSQYITTNDRTLIKNLYLQACEDLSLRVFGSLNIGLLVID